MRYLLLIFVLFNAVLTAQFADFRSVLEVNYLIKFQRDTANANSMTEEMASLLIGEETSLFKSTRKVIYDSLILAEAGKSINRAAGGHVVLDFSRVPSPKFISEVYKDGDQTIIYDQVLKTGFLYPLSEKIQWQIRMETKNISGYACRRATATVNQREYTAWFAPQLAFSEGPHIFKGLPGLILEVYDNRKLHHFQMAGLKIAARPIVKPSGITTTHSRFAKARSDFMKDPIGVFESRSKFKFPVKDRERIIKLHRGNNNFIF